MKKWTSVVRYARLLALVALCVLISWRLPEHLRNPINIALDWLSKWAPVGILVIIALIGYILINWVPKFDWHSIKGRFLAFSFTLELIAALVIKFWYDNAGGAWVVLWAVLVLISVTHLSAHGRNVASSLRDGPQQIDPKPRFLVDRPVTTPASDGLERKRLVQAIVRSIEEYSSVAPTTLSINGGWGTGKSSVMKLMQHDLELGGHKTVWVNAWVYDNKLAIWKAMIQAIMELMKDHHLPVNLMTSMNSYYKAAREVISSQESVKWLGTLMQELPTNDSLDNLKNRVSRLIADLVGGKRLVVFVDDLDRCTPESTLGTLEFLKEIVDFDYCVFVVGMDRDSVEQVLNDRYQQKGRDFLRKIINVSVDLSEASPHHLRNLFSNEFEVITGLKPEAEREDLAKLLESVHANPRAIKHILNSFLVVREMLRPIIDLDNPEITRAVLYGELLRFRHPDVHNRLRSPSVFDQLRSRYWDYLRNRRKSSRPLAEPDSAETRWFSVLAEELNVPLSDAAWISNILELGGFMTSVTSVLTVPKSIFFAYADPPSWISESRMLSLLTQLRDNRTTVADVLQAMVREGPEKAREFVSRCVSFRNEIYRANDQVYTFGGLYTEFDVGTLERILVEVISFQKRSGIEVFPRKDIQSFISAELKHESERHTLQLVQSLLDRSAWTPEALLEITRHDRTRQFTLSPVVEQQFDAIRLEVSNSVWAETLTHLADKPILEGHALYEIVTQLQTNLLALRSAHYLMVRSAKAHANDEGWVTNFRLLLHKWLEWEQVGGAEHFRSMWVQAAENGLLEAIKVSVEALNLRPEPKQWFNSDVGRLEQMTEKFRSGSLGDQEEEGPVDSENE